MSSFLVRHVSGLGDHARQGPPKVAQRWISLDGFKSFTSVTDFRSFNIQKNDRAGRNHSCAAPVLLLVREVTNLTTNSYSVTMGQRKTTLSNTVFAVLISYVTPTRLAVFTVRGGEEG